MKKSMLLLVFTLFSLTQALGYEGLWYTRGNESIIEIRKVGNRYQGSIVWLQNPLDKEGNVQRDKKNPNKALRNRQIDDVIILSNFQEIKGMLKKGKIYDPDSGNTYSCTMKIKDNILEVHGYIGFSLIGRTEKWTRCAAIPAAQN